MSPERVQVRLPQYLEKVHLHFLPFEAGIEALTNITNLVETSLEVLTLHHPELRLKTLRMSELQRIAVVIARLPAAEQPRAAEIVNLLQTLTNDPAVRMQANPLNAALDVGETVYRTLLVEANLHPASHPRDLAVFHRFEHVLQRLRVKEALLQNGASGLRPVVEPARPCDLANRSSVEARADPGTIENPDPSAIAKEPEPWDLDDPPASEEPRPLTVHETPGIESRFQQENEQRSEAEMLRQILAELVTLREKVAGLEALRKSVGFLERGLSGLNVGLSQVKHQLAGLETRICRKV